MRANYLPAMPGSSGRHASTSTYLKLLLLLPYAAVCAAASKVLEVNDQFIARSDKTQKNYRIRFYKPAEFNTRIVDNTVITDFILGHDSLKRHCHYTSDVTGGSANSTWQPIFQNLFGYQGIEREISDALHDGPLEKCIKLFLDTMAENNKGYHAEFFYDLAKQQDAAHLHDWYALLITVGIPTLCALGLLAVGCCILGCIIGFYTQLKQNDSNYDSLKDIEILRDDESTADQSSCLPSLTSLCYEPPAPTRW